MMSILRHRQKFTYDVGVSKKGKICALRVVTENNTAVQAFFTLLTTASQFLQHYNFLSCGLFDNSFY